MVGLDMIFYRICYIIANRAVLVLLATWIFDFRRRLRAIWLLI